MRIVSFQGGQLTPGQRRNLEFQQRTKQAFMNPVLEQQVEEALRAVEVRKEQGIKPQSIWFLETQETGTSSVAEWMGF